MSIVRNLLERRAGWSNNDDRWWTSVIGRPSATGVTVNSNTAMFCVPYFAGVRIIAETVGQLPLIEYRRLNPRGKQRATDRRVYQLLHDAPNPEMNAISFKETMQGHAVTWGNAFAEIEWDMDLGMPRALWPLRPDRMKVGRDDKTRELLYIYTLPSGEPVKLPSWRIWHMPGFGFDGLIGYDPIFLAREAIGMALAMEEYGARFFGNGASPGGVLEHPNHLSDSAKSSLRTSWNEMHQGLSNQHRIAILEEGMKYTQIGIPPDHAQFLESRKFQLNEISRLLHIPPHMLADLDRATFSNIEQQGIEFVQYTMTPWLVRWEQTCNRKLLTQAEQPIFFCEFLVDALLRGDSASRSNFYRNLFYMAALSPNDIREKENLNPIDDPEADKYFIQTNMMPLGSPAPAGAQQQSWPDQQNNSTRAAFEDAIRRVAEREEQNLTRQYSKNPGSFETYLNDFFRDFPEFIQRQLEPVLGDRTADFVTRYVDDSRSILQSQGPTALGAWSMNRTNGGSQWEL